MGRIYIKLHFFADFSAMCLAWNENYVSYLLTKCRNLSHHKPNEFSTQHVFQKSRFVWFKQQLLSFLIYFLFQDVEYVAANKHFKFPAKKPIKGGKGQSSLFGGHERHGASENGSDSEASVPSKHEEHSYCFSHFISGKLIFCKNNNNNNNKPLFQFNFVWFP